MRKYVSVLVAVMLALAIGLSTAEAQLDPVCGTIGGFSTPPGPGAGGYLPGTKACSLGVTVFSSTTTCADDAGIEATFSSPLSVRLAGVVGGGWLTWSSPPFSEFPFPIVGFTSGASSLTIDLTNPVSVFGEEIEPNVFAVFSITVGYHSGPGGTGTLLASTTQSVNGFAGARLFAAVCTTPAIRSVTITAPSGALGFAIGQLRSDGFAGFAAPALIAQPLASVPEGATSNASDEQPE